MNTQVLSPLRRGIIVVWLLAVAGLLLPSCAGSQEEKSAPPVAGEFVGEAPGANNAFVALVAEAPQGEEGEEAREVTAYVCDGEAIFEWFWGSASGDEVELSSEGGARLAARLEGSTDGQRTSVAITPPEGEPAEFELSAPPVLEAGEYRWIVLADEEERQFDVKGFKRDGSLPVNNREMDL